MKKICRHLSSILVLAALVLSLCMSATADDLHVSVEKVGEIPDKFDVFTGGEQESFSYMFMGAGFGVLDENRNIRLVDVNGESHIDKVYGRDIQKLYHGRYQFGNPVSDKDEKQYDLIKECTTICYSNIQARIDLHDDLFVFAADGSYVVFDLDDAKELAKVPASEGTNVGIFDDDYFIFRMEKRPSTTMTAKRPILQGTMSSWAGTANSTAMITPFSWKRPKTDGITSSIPIIKR